MKRSARTANAASDEFAAAVRWYESQRPGLGAEFFEAVVATIERIQQQPETGAATYPDPRLRRLLVRRFPYEVVYRLMATEVEIVAIAHLKRRPGYWKHRD